MCTYQGQCHELRLGCELLLFKVVICEDYIADMETHTIQSLAAEVQFDVIVADPPWQLATHAPTRGVSYHLSVLLTRGTRMLILAFIRWPLHINNSLIFVSKKSRFPSYKRMDSYLFG